MFQGLCLGGVQGVNDVPLLVPAWEFEFDCGNDMCACVHHALHALRMVQLRSQAKECEVYAL